MGEDSIFQSLAHGAFWVSSDPSHDEGVERDGVKGLEQVQLLLRDYLDLERRPDRRRFLNRAIESVDLLIRRSRRPCPLGIFKLPGYRMVARRVPPAAQGRGDPSHGVAGLFWIRYRFPLHLSFALFDPGHVHLQELELQGVLLNGNAGYNAPEFLAVKNDQRVNKGDRTIQGSLSPTAVREEDAWAIAMGPHEFSLAWPDPGCSPEVKLIVELAVPPGVDSSKGPLLLLLQARVKVSGAKHDGWTAANVMGLSL